MRIRRSDQGWRWTSRSQWYHNYCGRASLWYTIATIITATNMTNKMTTTNMTSTIISAKITMKATSTTAKITNTTTTKGR